MPQLQTVIGIAAGTFTSVSLLPQLIKMIHERKATDISVLMLATLLTGLALWIWYGIMREDWPIIITNGFSFVTNAVMIGLRNYYLRKGRQ